MNLDVTPSRWTPVLERLAAGQISPQIALVQLLLSGNAPDPARLAAMAAADPECRPLAALATLAAQQGDQLNSLRALVADGIDPTRAGAEETVAATRALFDRLAREAPEAGVALYSLGDPALLDAATAELVAVVADWTRLAGRDVLDFGCGIGRVAIPLAPRAKSVLGIDLSPDMLTEARRRTGALPNATFRLGEGANLASVPDDSIDLMLAVDSFPYVVQAGHEALHEVMREAARGLRPGGELLVFNWSYRGDLAADVAEAQALAATSGFTVLRAGERPFAIWDAAGFHLRGDA